MSTKRWSDVTSKGGGIRYTTTPTEDKWELTSSGWMTGVNHPRQNSAYRSGGPWQMQRVERYAPPTFIRKLTGQGKPYWIGSARTGHVIGAGNDSSFPALIGDATLDAYGATAFARTVPTVPSYSLVTSLRELRADGLPAIIGSTLLRDKAKEARQMPASEYLNVEFGWKPLVSDLRSFLHSVKTSDKILQQYKKDSDKQIRRDFSFPQVVAQGDWSGNCIIYPTSVGNFATGTTTQLDTEKKWFEGVFKYHVPDSGGSLEKVSHYASLADHLLGVKPTPENIWNSSPWTWGIDWFTNVGDVMTNISAMGTDSLQLVYGYQMRSRIIEVRTVSSLTLGTVRHGFTLTENLMAKQRRPANPYGFGLSGLATTTRQKAISAAIAVTMTGGKR